VVGNISISRIEISFEPELIDPTGTDLVFYPLRRLQKSFVKPQTKLGKGFFTFSMAAAFLYFNR
jgi:hypothetical protein